MNAFDLIRSATDAPPAPLVDGLWYEGELAGLHGQPEAMKTFLALQLAESLAAGRPFLGLFKVPRVRRVCLCETEMNVSTLGLRLAQMNRGQRLPDGLTFASAADLRTLSHASNLEAKFAVLAYIADGSDVLILDTANCFFRGAQSGNDERFAGEFFDRLAALPGTKLFVRHDRKRHGDAFESDDGAGSIRGSGQFADWPDLLLQSRRPDRRLQSATLRVTKFRNGTTPPDVELWLDLALYRLRPLPPVVAVLAEHPSGLPREDLIAHAKARFGIGHATVDAMANALGEFVRRTQSGHAKRLILDRDALAEAAEPPLWAAALGDGVRDAEDSISRTPPLCAPAPGSAAGGAA